MKIERAWAMPNSNTFSIQPISLLISSVFVQKCLVGGKAVDPFCRNSKFKDRCVTNDLDEKIEADFHMDALDFLKTRKDGEFDIILFDPPYSPRQVSECYKKHGRSVNMETTQASFWSNIKKEIQRISKPNAISVSCGWNSGGIGEKYGFEIQEILMVAHGGWHNDTIVTVEKKRAPSMAQEVSAKKE
jgi:hypothetical protein